MKRSIWVIVAVVLVVSLASCDGNVSKGEIAPPSWIIGEWDWEAETATFIFTADNAVLEYSSGALDLNFKEMGKTGGVSIVDSNPLPNEYVIKILDIDGGPITTFYFTLEADDTLSVKDSAELVLEGFKRRE